MTVQRDILRARQIDVHAAARQGFIGKTDKSVYRFMEAYPQASLQTQDAQINVHIAGIYKGLEEITLICRNHAQEAESLDKARGGQDDIHRKLAQKALDTLAKDTAAKVVATFTTDIQPALAPMQEALGLLTQKPEILSRFSGAVNRLARDIGRERDKVEITPKTMGL